MNATHAARLGRALFAGALASIGSLGCGGSPFRGGYATPESAVLGTKTLARFVPEHCEDAARAEHAPRFNSVELVENASGRPLLLEHRQGHELLVAENHYDQGAFRVFEVVVQGRVRRWRIPLSSLGTGTFEVGRELTEVGHGERFEAGLASSHLTCRLSPQAG